MVIRTTSCGYPDPCHKIEFVIGYKCVFYETWFKTAHEFLPNQPIFPFETIVIMKINSSVICQNVCLCILYTTVIPRENCLVPECLYLFAVAYRNMSSYKTKQVSSLANY